LLFEIDLLVLVGTAVPRYGPSSLTLRGFWPLVFLFSGYLIAKQLAILKILNNLKNATDRIEPRLYSLRLENTPQKKHSAAQILSHKIFSFCEQTLKMGANDASCQGLQSALKNKHQNIF
jgi:hypothetical protein